MLQLDGVVMKGGRRLKVNIAVPNLRLFVGNIPKFKGKAELMEEFGKRTGKTITSTCGIHFVLPSPSWNHKFSFKY